MYPTTKSTTVLSPLNTVDPKGFANMHSNCFMNSALHSLVFICQRYISEAKYAADDLDPLTLEFLGLMRAYYSQASPLDMSRFIVRCVEIDSSWSTQQDSLQFFQWLTDRVLPKLGIQDPFAGKECIHSHNSCGCRVKPFLSPTGLLEVKQSDGEDVERALRSQVEVMELVCDQCNRQTQRRQVRNLAKLPNVLAVQFEEKRNMPPETLFDAYRLQSCVLYVGNARSGHYSAVVRGESSWFLCDDSSVVPFQGMPQWFCVQYAVYVSV